MGKGGVKHQADIIKDVQKTLEEQNGVMTLQNLVQILMKFYSEGYSEGQGQMIILRELERQNIAKLAKIKLPDTEDTRENKHMKKNPYLSLLVSMSVKDSEKQRTVAAFLRNFLPKRIPPLKRSVSKEILVEALPKLQKRVETIEFPSIRFRAMLLHGFLLKTFGGRHFTLEEISKCLPVGLSIQLIRGIKERKVYPHLSIIEPLDRNGMFELDMIVSFLKPPFQFLVTRDNVVCPTARVVFEHFGIDRTFEFLRDPTAYSDYWILMNSLANEQTWSYPLSIIGRFEGTVSKVLSHLSTYYLPFFPRQVERVACVLGVVPHIVSYAAQRTFKIRLREAQCPKETFLDSKLFPSTGIVVFLVSGKSALPVKLPELPRSFDTEFDVDDSSPRSLAKLFAVSLLTTQGYIQNRRSNFQLFRSQFEKWIVGCSKSSNVFVSVKKDPVFLSLIHNEMANVIASMRVPIQDPVIEEDETEEKIESPDVPDEDPEAEMNRSQSARFVEASKSLISAVLVESDAMVPRTTKSIEELREAFATSFPQRSTSTEVEDSAFEAAQVDSPSCSMSENDEPEFSEDEEAEQSHVLSISTFESDDELPPAYELGNLIEVTESQFLSFYTIRKNISRCPLSVSIAMEFIKSVLGTASDGEGSEYLRVRQLCHLHPGDISKAVWYLTGCDAYQNTWNIKIPRTKWKLRRYDKTSPHPIHIQLLEEVDPPVTLEWIAQDAIQSAAGVRKPQWDEKEKKREYTFEWAKARYLFPKLPPIEPSFIGGSLNYDGDPLGHFTFGRYEDPLTRGGDFLRRYVVNLIHAGGVDGVSILDIFEALNASPTDRTRCDKVIDLLDDLCASGDITRVPSSSLTVHYSCFLALNRMYSKTKNGIELVDVHLWTKWDGSVSQEMLHNTRTNIATYVFGHEFCDFGDILTHFSYISPFDLCLLLESLESDEILVSDYFELHEATLTEPQRTVPVAPFRNPALFLALYSLHMNGPSPPSPTLHRRLRTTRDVLTRLSGV